MRAVVLAGGRGTRLAPLSFVVPKPLVPIGNVPVLELLLRQLAHHGAQHVTISVDYLADLIRAWLVTQKTLAEHLHVDLMPDASPVGTAGPLAGIPDLSGDFLVMNGDVLTTLDFAAFFEAHQASGAALTIAVHDRSVKVNLGVLEVDDDGRVTDYREKPELPYLCSMGVYAYNERALRFIEHGKRLDLPDLVLRLLDEGEPVQTVRHPGYWLDLGNPDDYMRAQDEAGDIFGDLLDEARSGA